MQAADNEEFDLDEVSLDAATMSLVSAALLLEIDLFVLR